jgi:integrase/recombinase XerC
MYQQKFISYLSSERRLSQNTIISYSNDLDQFHYFLNEHFNITSQISDVSFHIVRGWVANLFENGVQPRSINRKISTLKTFFKYLEREEFIDVNPMLKVVGPKASKNLPLFVKENEIKLLLEEVTFDEGFIGKRDKLIIEIFYLTGMRLTELINIKLTDLDFHNKSIKVIGKRNKERIIPLSDSILSSMQSFIKEFDLKEFLITNSKGNKVYSKLVYRVVRKYLSKITSINKKSPHILRHTFATHMLNNGADINAIKDLLGHSNLNATQVYTHNTVEKLKSIYKQAHPRA